MPDDDTPRPERRPWEKKPRDDDDSPPEARRRPRRDDRDDDDDDDRPRRRRRRERDDDEDDYDPAMKMVVPLNTSGLAIAAGYLGLVSVLCLPAPFALLLGILALQHLRKHPKQDGKVRAIFGIVMGTIFSGVMVVAGIGLLLSQK